uniref:Uncharacterized protein n=1 Tax=Daphnia galeata TaxID=27404 RepID=A0A8J2RAG1_9CRUS|nr:unnamed protein product [Daphnia galeata]
MQLESDFMHRVLKGCLVQPHYGLNVLSLKQLSLQATAFWAVCTLHRLHDSPEKIQRASSDEIMKAARDCITNKIPSNLVDDFVVQMLNTIDVVYEQSRVGRQLLVYVGSFIPRNLRILVMPLCLEQVTIAAILTLPLCTNLTELYMERADQSVITQGILCHILKYLRRLKVLALPKQCNDSVIAVVGQNCPSLENIVLNDTGVTNTGIAWLLCCRHLHTVIMLKTEVSPPGAALLLHGLPSLNVLLYDSIADTLWYCSVNAAVSPKFALKTVAFGATDLLTPGHLELLSQMCPGVEWLSLNSAFTYSVQTLGFLPKLTLLSVNFRGGSLDIHFEDFLRRNGMTIRCLQLVEAQEMEWTRFEKLLIFCPALESLVFYECSFERFELFEHVCELRKAPGKIKLKNLQVFRTPLMTPQLEHLVSILPNLNRLELGHLDWDVEQIRTFLTRNKHLEIFRVLTWRLNGLGATVASSLLWGSSRNTRCLNHTLQLEFPGRVIQLDGNFTNTAPFQRGIPQFLLAEYGELSPLLDITRIGRN